MSDGSWTRLEGDTSPISVSVTRAISWNAPSAMRRGVPYTIIGQVQPAAPGVSVTLSATGASLSATTDANGNFSFTVNNSAPGFYTYVASTQADSNFAASQSPFVTVVVR
jgi:hypothetical protein